MDSLSFLECKLRYFDNFKEIDNLMLHRTQTPLHTAAVSGKMESLHILLDAGADLAAKDVSK